MKRALVIGLLLFLCGSTAATDDFVRTYLSAAQQMIGKIEWDWNYSNGRTWNRHEGSGVCTDLILDALLVAGYDLKAEMDADILAHPKAYPHRYSPHIDSRRCRNQIVYFRRHWQVISNAYPGDWLPGDIVFYRLHEDSPWTDHVAIVSDRIHPSGIPYVIDNHPASGGVSETFVITGNTIVGHFRYRAR